MKTVFLCLLVLCLCGCAAEPTFETVSDEQVAPVSAQIREMEFVLPMDAASPVLVSENAEIYLCGQYEISKQILPSGDLQATLRQVSGFDRDKLTMLETSQNDVTRYEFTWVSVSDAGDQVGRGCILDDGDYHYCLSVLGSAEAAAEYRGIWESMFASLTLS